MKYCLDVRLKPAEHYIHVCGKIIGTNSNKFCLNENFTLLSASSNGDAVDVHMDKNQPHPPFDTVSRPIFFDTDNSDIEFEYEGYIPKIINDTNLLNEDTVELASYSGWYPKPDRNFNSQFDFELHLQMPSGYELASNGQILSEQHIVSVAPDMDIVLFASKIASRVTYEHGSKLYTYICPHDMCAEMEQKAENLAKANFFFESTFGKPKISCKTTEILSVYSPRNGGGYKRGNLTICSAEYEKTHPDLHGDFHELAHGWWNIANVTTNDWINEGGAEFSAFLIAAQIYGKSFTEPYIADCLQEIANTTEKVSISDTDYTSSDRYTNHYLKTMIMFINAVVLFGRENVLALLKRVFQTYKGTRNADTQGFLSLCDPDMKCFFEQYLLTDNWNTLDYQLPLQSPNLFEKLI